MLPLRAAILGLGNVAWRYDQGDPRVGTLTHASCFRANATTNLVGGCSPDAADRAGFEEALGVPAYATETELLDHERPDIVSICSSVSVHEEHVMLCAERGISMVWLEKPPASSLAAFESMASAVEHAPEPPTVLVNYQRRYMANYRTLRETFQRETLGACQGIQINYSRGLEANGSHMLDMLFYVLDGAQDYGVEWVSSDEESPCFSIQFDGGPRVVVSGHDLPYHCIDFSLTCDKGRCAVLQGGKVSRTETAAEHTLFAGFFRLENGAADADGDAQFTSAMPMALDDLISSHGAEHAPVSSLDTARATQCLMEQVRSCQRGTTRS